MADTWSGRAQHVAAAARTGWMRTIAYLAPRYRRMLAGARIGWAWTIAYLAPRWRRFSVAARAGWTRVVAFVVPRWRRLVAAARTQTRPGRRRDATGSAARRSAPADLGSRISRIAKQSVASDIDFGEDVSLFDLLDHADREPQHQY